MAIEDDFPNLAETGHRITSPESGAYNCIAWAAGTDQHWWEPATDCYWPESTSMDYTVDALVQAFKSIGFAVCENAVADSSSEKIAIYGDGQEYTHAARQLPNGKWTSKLGKGEDIEHDNLEALEGSIYGSVVCVMQRSRTSTTG